MHLTLDKWVIDSVCHSLFFLGLPLDIAKLKDNDQMWCIVSDFGDPKAPALTVFLVCYFPLFLSLSSSHKNWLKKKWLRALVIGLMPLFAVYNLKHAIWLSNYDSLKRILKEPQNTGYKVIVMKIIKIIFIYFFELFLMNISLAGHTKSCQLKVFSNPQNIIILSLQAAQYTFKI